MTLAESLTARAEAAGLNHRQLAEAAGLAPTTVYRVLRGERSPGVEVLAAIGRALKIQPTAMGRLVYLAE